MENGVNWAANDKIIVASTDFFTQMQTERMTITSVSGRTISLNSFLQFTHYGQVYVPGSTDADFVRCRDDVAIRDSPSRASLGRHAR